jgi:hypothetical protein
LSIVAGAFRFTTDPGSKRRRDVAIQARLATAGIRGTDLWGKSTDERSLICLLEGKITVASEGHPEVVLDTPLDYYQRPREGAPSVAKVDPKQLEEWAKETELTPGAGAAVAGGKWRVVAAANVARDQALALNRSLRQAGYPSEIVQKDGAWAVQVRGLAGEAEARALAGGLARFRGAESASIQGPM